MRVIIALYFLLLCTVSLYAREADSLSNLSNQDKIPYVHRLYYRSFTNASVAAAEQQYQLMIAGTPEPAVQAAALAFLGKYYTGHNENGKAVNYYLQAWQIAGQHHLTYLQPVLLHLLGIASYKQDEYASGLERLIKANTQMQQLGTHHFPDMGGYLYDLGYAYAYYYEDFDTAMHYVHAALQYPMPDYETEILSHNMLGLLYRSTGKPDTSYFYFHKALQLAEAAHDTILIGDITGNIGYNYLMEGKFDSAYILIRKDYQLSMLKNNYASACMVLPLLARIANMKGDKATARLYLQQTRELLHQHRKGISLKAIYTICSYMYGIVAEQYREENNMAAAVKAQDTLITYRDSLFLTKESKQQARIQINLIKESMQYQMQLLKSEEKRNILLRNTLIVICLLIIIVAVQTVYRLKRANDTSEALLIDYANSLVEKNQLIEQFKAEMQQLKNQPDYIEHEIEDIFKALRNHTILTDEDWSLFRQLFERVYKNFFTNITEKLPDITQSELRLLALTKLGLSTKEMAAMQGISPESIRKARYRLRKKLEDKAKEEKDIAFMLKTI